jgi:hypothetical protein
MRGRSNRVYEHNVAWRMTTAEGGGGANTLRVD